MEPLRLYIVRHAPVIGKQGVIYGDNASIDLEKQTGKIKSLANLLPDTGASDWYCSGVDRAHKTAQAVLTRMGCSEAPIGIHEGFREQNFGNLLGQKHDEIADHIKFVDGKIYAPHPPGGETIEDLIKRVSSAIFEVKQAAIENGKKNIVVFSHGGTIRAAHVALKKADVKEFICLDTPPLFAYRCDVRPWSAV